MIRTVMPLVRKSCSVLTAVLYALLSLSPLSGITWASSEAIPSLQYQSDGMLAQGLSVPPEGTESEASFEEPSAEALVDFLSQGPLSPVDEAETASNDPFYGSSGSWGQNYEDLWWLKDVNADDAWTLTKGAGSTVAVIDTGLDFSHPDISGNVWSNAAEAAGLPGVDDDANGYVDDIRGWDFHNRDNDPQDDHGHGTHVSGIVGAVADNFIGIAGIAPESKIIPLKVLNAGGSGYVTNVISAIRYAAELGAKVINMSLGILKAFLPKSLKSGLESAINYAINKGTVVVAAAGNENANVSNTYPAGYSPTIAVGAVVPVTHKRAWFSNFGSLLDFAAPGVDVLSLRAGGTNFGSTSPHPDYSRASGTSMASPIVAGVAALLKSQYPTLTVSEVYSRLRSSAADLGTRGFDKYYGWGLVDAYKALTAGSSSGASLSTSASTSGNHKKNGLLSNLKQSLEGGLTLPPRLSQSPIFAGNWYFIESLGTGYDTQKRRKRLQNFLPTRQKSR